ncbi:hypothetical protein [Pseudomonas sp. B21-053]|uniref:hypothetical protein n=1 Tax=Pseudomonas sp. B21-053 TaxID=2895493 RepID=UPI002231734A|nr:hypothetical protein [Pseudomonas sp. B21-053]UZE14794.1 hypothetical protein LOY68_14680 [Pseudomonas sp. B21-053]
MKDLDLRTHNLFCRFTKGGDLTSEIIKAHKLIEKAEDSVIETTNETVKRSLRKPPKMQELLPNIAAWVWEASHALTELRNIAAHDQQVLESPHPLALPKAVEKFIDVVTSNTTGTNFELSNKVNLSAFERASFTLFTELLEHVKTSPLPPGSIPLNGLHYGEPPQDPTEALFQSVTQ